jgi:hypothetical protein
MEPGTLRGISPSSERKLQSIPFKDQPNGLEKGVHLHWALPDALTKSIPTPILTKYDIRKLLREQPGTLDVESILAKIWDFLLKSKCTLPINEEYASILVDPTTLKKKIEGAEERDLINELFSLPGLMALFSPRSTHYPPVPDHWTIKRIGGGNEKTWTLESTYVHTWGEKPPPNSTPFPTGGPAWGDPEIYRWDGKRTEGNELSEYFNPDKTISWDPRKKWR